MDMIMQYIPLMRPLPRVRTPFPFLASREDWPFKRESIGGWVLSPFGGRGRIGTEIVEIEGLLGVQDPALYTAGQVLEFGLVLWSKSAKAMKLLGQPAAVSVGYFKADFLPSSEALRPRAQSRQTRTMQRTAEGRVWVADAGRPREGAPVPELVSLDLAANGAGPSTSSFSSSPSSAPPSPPQLRRATGSRMQSVWTADGDEERVVDGEGHTKETSSPTHSIEELDDMQGTDEYFQRLDGELRIPPCRPVSYRYTNIGREYSLQLHITHPQYAHISPTGPGLLAEVPIWYVSDRALKGGPAALNQDPAYLSALPMKGATIPVDGDVGVVRWPRVVGQRATEGRAGKPKLGQMFLGLVPPPKDVS
ncbi:hypothetical protein C8R46DRAFT_117289 [Mycena filopes]|nr:hypothetical protein C8R46DRAFT_117289 [Mycena filopes]